MSTPVATSSQTAVERPRRADAVRNRARVLEAAYEAFAQSGLDAQIEDVARRAGVGVGTVYRHFPTKERLIEALVVDRFSALADETRAALGADSAWDAFQKMIWRSAAMQAEDQAFCEVMASPSAHTPAGRAAMEELQAVTAKLARRAQKEGDLRSDLRTRDIPMLFCGIGRAVGAAGGFPGADWRTYVEILVDGLRAR